MANLNLSEFTEKLFVADADHTFIWDTANAISKRVSRNSWLNSGTLTSDAPVTISQTWNAVGQTFTALKVNAAGTSDANSASGSLVADFQVNAASKVSVTKTGAVRFGDGGFEPGIARVALGTVAVSLLGFSQNHVSLGYYGGASNNPGVTVSSLGHFAWSSSSTNSEATRDTILLRDGAANTLALRNGAAAQTFNVYGTYTSASVYERMFMRYNGTDLAFQVGAETLGATARPLQLWTGGASRLHITTAGNVGIGTTAPTSRLHVQATGQTGVRENLLKCTVSDSGNDAFYMANATVADGSFVPGFIGAVFSSSARYCLNLAGQTTAANDTGTAPMVAFSAAITTDATDPNNGTLSAVGTRPLFTWVNFTTTHMQMSANGNLGIGTTSPTSKLQVSAGDVEVDTIAKGVILKSPDGTRYRVTVANGGTLSVAAV